MENMQKRKRKTMKRGNTFYEVLYIFRTLSEILVAIPILAIVKLSLSEEHSTENRVCSLEGHSKVILGHSHSAACIRDCAVRKLCLSPE